MDDEEIKGKEQGLMIPNFNGVQFQIVDANGEKWVPVKQLAEALEYASSRELRKLLDRNAIEFEGKTERVRLTPSSGGSPTLVINYHGVIRASMLSDAPKAPGFRDYAETVLFAVMTKGFYFDPRVKDTLVAPLISELTLLIDSKIAALSSSLMSRMVPRDADVSDLLTPTQRLRQLVFPNKLPKDFNSRGAFDHYFGEEHYRERGSYPRVRSRRFMGKMPEFVVYECPEDDDLLRRTYRKYLKIWPSRQRKLNLKPPRRPRDV